MKRSSIPKVGNLTEEVLCKTWTTLSRFTYDYTLPDGRIERHVRESYNRGNGMTALLYNPEEKKILLIRQFRLPTYVNGNPTGMLIEAPAGKLEESDPDAGIRREIEEETGHRVTEVEKVMEVYMSPGSVTELLHFYVAKYSKDTKVSEGGGLHHEQENIELLELALPEALELVKRGEIRDAKTIMLLQYAALHNLV